MKKNQNFLLSAGRSNQEFSSGKWCDYIGQKLKNVEKGPKWRWLQSPSERWWWRSVSTGRMGNWGRSSCVASSGQITHEAHSGDPQNQPPFCSSYVLTHLPLGLEYPTPKFVRTLSTPQGPVGMLPPPFSCLQMESIFPSSGICSPNLTVALGPSHPVLGWRVWMSSSHYLVPNKLSGHKPVLFSVSASVSLNKGSWAQSLPRSLFFPIKLSLLSWSTGFSFLSFYPDSYWENIDYYNLSNHHLPISIYSEI